MNFIKYSITFKILLVAAVMATIFEIGIRFEGAGQDSLAVFWSWFNQIISTIPFTPGDPYSVAWALTNGFFFYGSFGCLIVIQFFIKDGFS